MSGAKRTFTCSSCQQTFVSEWTEEEARQEAAQVFGGITLAEQDVVCDDCYQKFMKWFASNSAAQ